MAGLGGKPGAEGLALKVLKHTEESLQVLSGTKCTLYIIKHSQNPNTSSTVRILTPRALPDS